MNIKKVIIVAIVMVTVATCYIVSNYIMSQRQNGDADTILSNQEVVDEELTSQVDWSQIDDIVAYAEEHGLTIGVDYGDEVVDYNETVAAAYNSEESERERAEIEALLEELETGEVIIYYPETGKMVIE